MRTVVLLLVMAFFSVAAQSQVPSDVVSPQDASFNAVYDSLGIPRVTGKLLNVPAGELKDLIITYYIVTPFSQFPMKMTTVPDPDGSFRLAMGDRLPYQEVGLEVGDAFNASLICNKDLYVELDMEKIKAGARVSFDGDAVKYLGADGPMNKYLNDYALYRKPEQDDLNARVMTLVDSFQAKPDSMLPRYNILFDSIKGMEDSYITANPSPYSWILANERMSDYYGQLCSAYWYKTMEDSLWQKVKQHKSYLISSNGVCFYSNMTIYLRFLPGSKVASPQTEMREARLLHALDNDIRKLDSVFPTAEADFLKLRLDISTDVSDQEMSAERILASMQTTWCIAMEKEHHQQIVAKINDINQTLAHTAPGPTYALLGKPVIQTAFGASLYMASGKATDLLAKLKQSFPGKAIIIDRWATWCVACLAEMPHSKELQESSKDVPVVFVYLCTIKNSTEDKWKVKVAELKQPGIHILIDNALDADLTNYFSFNGYPGYALIGKDGSYQPGAFHWMSEIGGRDALAALINR